MSFAWNNRAAISAALCSVALAFGIASCDGKIGGSGTGATGATAPGTKQAGGAASGPSTAAQVAPASVTSKQFIAQADAICRRANAGIARSETKLKGKRRKPDAHAAVVTRNQEIEEEAIKELVKLKPTADLTAAWQKMSLYRQALAHQLGVYVTATRLRVTNLGPLVASKKKLHAELREVGSRAGFNDCAKLG
jgi:hypothetical protein